MKNIYKMIIACFITAVITAVATTLVVRNYYTVEYEIEMLCTGGASPDLNGCCPGEEYTDMQEQGFNCCPIAGGDCFPPIEK